MEIFNLYSGSEWFIDGKLCTGTPQKYPRVEGDGITYILRAHEIIVYARLNCDEFSRTVNNEFRALSIIHADKLNDNIACSKHANETFNNFTVTRPLTTVNVSIKFEDILYNISDNMKSKEFNIDDTCAVVYDPDNILNLKHNDIVYKLSVNNFTGCEDVYPKKILVSSIDKPLGIYFNKVWSHINEFFNTDEHPFSNTSKYITAGEYDESLPQACFICTSNLYDTNYIMCDKIKTRYSKLPELIAVCPWCFHSFDSKEDRYNFKSDYNKIKLVEYPVRSADLINNVPEYDLRVMLKAINDNFRVEEYNDFMYVSAGNYIGITSIRQYVKSGLYNKDIFKGKKMFIIAHPKLVFISQ
jgi:hypothetical protein